MENITKYDWEDLDFSEPVVVGFISAVGWDLIEHEEGVDAWPFVDFVTYYQDAVVDYPQIERVILPQEDEVLFVQLSDLFREETLKGMKAYKQAEEQSRIVITKTKYGYEFTKE